MTLTTLDRRTALAVIDLQPVMADAPTSHPVGDVVASANRLAGASHRHGLPVVWVVVAGSPPGRTGQGSRPDVPPPDGYTELIPQLDRAPEDHSVTTYARSAFTHTGLAEYLRGEKVTQVVLVGVATSSGAETSARDAHEQGFHVTLAVDAMTDLTADAHEHSIQSVFPRIGETATTAAILTLLEDTRT